MEYSLQSRLLFPIFHFLTISLANEPEAPTNLRLTLIPLESFLYSDHLDKYGYGKGQQHWEQNPPKRYNNDPPKNCSEDLNRPEWMPMNDWSECTDNCGGCGSRWRRRKCQKKRHECGCQGPDKEEELCNFHVCLYPRPPCCGPLMPTSARGNFTCALLPIAFDVEEEKAQTNQTTHGGKE